MCIIATNGVDVEKVTFTKVSIVIIEIGNSIQVASTVILSRKMIDGTHIFH